MEPSTPHRNLPWRRSRTGISGISSQTPAETAGQMPRKANVAHNARQGNVLALYRCDRAQARWNAILYLVKWQFSPSGRLDENETGLPFS
jgi:hypothetical protein